MQRTILLDNVDITSLIFTDFNNLCRVANDIQNTLETSIWMESVDTIGQSQTIRYNSMPMRPQDMTKYLKGGVKVKQYDIDNPDQRI